MFSRFGYYLPGFCVCKADDDTTTLFDLGLAGGAGGGGGVATATAAAGGDESPVTAFESDSELAFATV